MGISRQFVAVMIVLAWQVVLTPQARACAACFGQSDDKMAKGMNAGIFSLLLVITLVLGGFFALMVFLVRRGVSHGDVMARRAEEIRMQLLKERVPANG